MNTAADEREDIIYGRNSVREAILSNALIECVFVQKGETAGSIKTIIYECRERHILIKDVAREKLDALCGGANHQGIALVTSAAKYASLDDIFASAKQKGTPPFIVICDEIEDPHNLGAIIRTAEAASVDGIIIPKRRSAGLTASTAKAASGALTHMLVARVPNIASCIEELKKRGVWIYGAEMDGQNYCKTDFTDPCAIVIGNEGEGLSRIVKEKCDFLVSLPMLGKINSLNASVACAVILYEAVRQRTK